MIKTDDEDDKTAFSKLRKPIIDDNNYTIFIFNRVS